MGSDTVTYLQNFKVWNNLELEVKNSLDNKIETAKSVIGIWNGWS